MNREPILRIRRSDRVVPAPSEPGTMVELHRNLGEVIEMLLEDGELRLEMEFVGTSGWEHRQREEDDRRAGTQMS